MVVEVLCCFHSQKYCRFSSSSKVRYLNKKEKVYIYIYIYFIESSYTVRYRTLYTQIKNLTQNIICFLTNMSY